MMFFGHLLLAILTRNSSLACWAQGWCTVHLWVSRTTTESGPGLCWWVSMCSFIMSLSSSRACGVLWVPASSDGLFWRRFPYASKWISPHLGAGDITLFLPPMSHPLLVLIPPLCGPRYPTSDPVTYPNPPRLSRPDSKVDSVWSPLCLLWGTPIAHFSDVLSYLVCMEVSSLWEVSVHPLREWRHI